MSRTRLINRDSQDDSVDIAGWVYADLLLSLAIIFLVSISFSIPVKSGSASTSDIQSAGQNEIKRADLGEQTPINQGFNFYFNSSR